MKKNEILKWTVTTIIVIIGVFILIRLGFWQLDRLEQRREFNAHYLEQISAPKVTLNDYPQPEDLVKLEYREVTVTGYYDFDHEIYLQNQAYNNQPGYRVVTPLLIEGKDSVVLVDRGWISFSDLEDIHEINDNFTKLQKIVGIIRNPKSDDKIVKTSKKSDSNPKFFLYVELDLYQKQVEFDVLPIYIQLSGNQKLEKPIPQIEEIEISEGPHFGYALQWFFFASLLGFGYPFFVRKQLREKKRETGNE